MSFISQDYGSEESSSRATPTSATLAINTQLGIPVAALICLLIIAYVTLVALIFIVRSALVVRYQTALCSCMLSNFNSL